MTKKRRHPSRYSTILRLEEAIHDNAVRLLIDACILYQAGSYSSAYALSILAHEELGKLEMVDHVGFEAELNRGDSPNLDIEHLFSRTMFYSHKNKQSWGTLWASGNNKRISKHIENGNLDRHKQDCFYVGYANNKISVPYKFKPFHAYEHLRYTIPLLENINDLPFYGVFEESTPETQDLAKDTILYVKEIFGQLKTPKQLKIESLKVDIE